ncbi:undecaprenyldiphospho-muramoylpentapeptide beta-N-acetylglucosaminyltransferase [Kurthia sibirica]|uniref:UDP-N-acetylglucosamine--N-acetylmuramyl-(pentapeptide) pyrophosphoryl-undecaprenol N-acetylglucosamine transferase n=1 Tax=Kurthia sibirica TaxID=202750 RepID=A0A2U3AP91_9BACL|nr:undecaprenyldiphospho-muramoylpentapeptide beta-N-acetylglucosaminyltransferase [Kurthia sibirica]PWI26368.1 undecaprenyldiphospho-muramoylpentapeptide beta-N-acetylglucosaminyltransferase [Kurthia sibirica]GEK34870.1 UDP-N-acetylglucosamine--N-acetylmuramyl-(pentapeptide) pyrophosphoryl-undecaprenol N-acetylglucosamine transferase [Kurthia sibirica]
MKNQTIVLTGGGTAGHVSLNQAIIPSFLEQGYDVHYIGSKDGIEREIIKEAFPEQPFHAISSGKLRRYFSLKNFTDPFKVLGGVFQALVLLKKLKPQIVFSKGGFVSVPVVMAAKILGIPVVSHESDVTPGLANKLSLPFASHIFTIFKETLNYLPSHKSTCTGSIIRSALFEGDRVRGLEICHFTNGKKTILVMGGSLGSKFINDAVRNNLTELLVTYNVIHLCGKGNVDDALLQLPGYKQFDYVTTELPDLLHASDYIVSRAGSNSIFEFLALKKPMLLIPLSLAQSRGDQLVNAKIFKQQGLAEVIQEEELTPESFMTALALLTEHEADLIGKMTAAEAPKTPAEMVNLIIHYAKTK